MDVFPITPEQILDRNRTLAAPTSIDTKKAYVVAFDTIGESLLIKLFDDLARRMYHITEDKDGQKVYKVNIARLIQMSGEIYKGPRKVN